MTRVILNTNGLRIAKDNRVVSALGRLGTVEVYLQFDGFELDSHLFHRGEDLREIKAMPAPARRGARVHDAGGGRRRRRQRPRGRRVAEYAFATDYIGGVAYQPVFGSGRANPIDHATRDDNRHAESARGADPRAGRAGGFHRAAVLPPRLLAIAYFVSGDSGQCRSVPKCWVRSG